MQLYNVRKKNNGFTLLEMLITVIVVGILAAILAPNLIGLYNQNQVRDGLAKVESSLKEAQRQAIKLSKTCTVSFNTTSKTITASPNGCLLSNRTLEGSVNITTNDSTPSTTFNMPFSYKGNYGGIGKTIIITGDNTNERKCLTITSGIGIMRTGDFVGNIPGGNCRVNSN